MEGLNPEEKEEKNKECCNNIYFNLATIFPCVYNSGDNFFLDYNFKGIFFLWFFGYPIFATLTMTNFFNERCNHYSAAFNCAFFAPFLVLILFISYEIIFTCLITPFILISLFYREFFYFIEDFLRINC